MRKLIEGACYMPITTYLPKNAIGTSDDKEETD